MKTRGKIFTEFSCEDTAKEIYELVISEDPEKGRLLRMAIERGALRSISLLEEQINAWAEIEPITITNASFSPCGNGSTVAIVVYKNEC